MSRLTSQPIQVQPSNNIYTALAGIALLVAAAGLVMVVLQANAVLPGGLDWTNFSMSAK